MDLLCLAMMFPREGSLGPKVTAKIGPSFWLGVEAFLSATFLGTFLALFIAESMLFSGYPLSMSVSSWKRCSLLWGSIQILTIRKLMSMVWLLLCAYCGSLLGEGIDCCHFLSCTSQYLFCLLLYLEEYQGMGFGLSLYSYTYPQLVLFLMMYGSWWVELLDLFYLLDRTINGIYLCCQ